MSIAHNVIESNLSLPLALHFPSAWQTLSELIHVPCLVPSPLLPLTRQPKYFKFKTKYYWSLRYIIKYCCTNPPILYMTYLSFHKRRSRLRMFGAPQIKDRGIMLNYRSFHHKRLCIWNHSCKLPEQATMCYSFHTHWGNILQSVSHMIFLKSIRMLFNYFSWKTI